ncbi:bacillithiol biosynthesis cysteine-adding enzyme BshC [Siphonobacter sp. BAB-5405]|uniref:bacillithiol biosynthesis cysteine-adding enzyme BshC n=1 Tax=Siphonobacter sp. BAB-5405 TaxID=1864825 RepID=UPI000C800B9C|nr:bacillithiol biosynthesis cysteine-adding enzyme BshC [Siphonobacter sp. BAB-5405]PMD95722.1 bacillithiol biosynthesis cysteine-adding enzyme BshC [Siphonobacter sp. BAB-5405]
MQVSCIPLAHTRQFSSLFQAFISGQENLKPFYGEFPDLEGFRKQIEQKKFDVQKRQTLVSVLEKQYAELDSKPDFQVLLDEKTFTVTSGHQLNLFTGPLYVIFKLVTAINLARRLKQEFPEYTFVPVYWMATEDHDFEEINHFRLSGKTHTWHTQQKGAVGRMNPKELATLFKEIPERLPLFEQAYLQHNTLADAVRYYIHELLGAEGLICIDADDRALKAEFRPVIEDDLFNHTAFKLVQEASEKLEAIGYKQQVTPREINFFYLNEGIRERLVPDENGVRVNDTRLTFDKDKIQSLLDQSPEVFSPNVILRPVYQEVILPNLAYLGGPGELAYWLQLKPVFDHYQIPYPILMPRNFAMIISQATQRRIQNLGLTPEELFQDEATLRRQYVEKHAAYSLDIQPDLQQMLEALEAMRTKAVQVNPTLDGHIKAEAQKLRNWAERLDRRLVASEAQKQETGVRHLSELKAYLFPGGGLQERTDNFLNFYLANPAFISQLLDLFDPFCYEFYMLTEA